MTREVRSWNWPGPVLTPRVLLGVPTVSRFRPAHPPEFRKQMVDLVRSGRTPEKLSREFEPSPQWIMNWVRQADREDGRRAGGATSVDLDELSRVRREVPQRRQKRDIVAEGECGAGRSPVGFGPAERSSLASKGAARTGMRVSEIAGRSLAFGAGCRGEAEPNGSDRRPARLGTRLTMPVPRGFLCHA